MPDSSWIEWRCSACGLPLAESGREIRCSSCERSWPVERGVPLFVDGEPAWMDDSECADTLMPLFNDENGGHWLYTSRMRAVLALVSCIFDRSDSPKVIDVGCGTGYVLKHLKDWGALTAGVEVSPDPLRLARERDRDSVYVCAPSDRLPFEGGQFDLAISLDVYEHLEDERPVVEETLRLLRPGGRHLVFVPAHRWLWSRTDKVQGHYRRYSRKMLLELLQSAGFEVERTGFIMPLFVPPVLLIRRLNELFLSEGKGSQASIGEFTMPPRPLNSAISAVLELERSITLRTGAPFGITAFAIARKAA
jgi:SAM-dependent methyltransferase